MGVVKETCYMSVPGVKKVAVQLSDLTWSVLERQTENSLSAAQKKSAWIAQGCVQNAND